MKKTYTVIEITSTDVYFNKFDNVEDALKYYKEEINTAYKGYGFTQVLLLTEGEKIWCSWYRN